MKTRSRFTICALAVLSMAAVWAINSSSASGYAHVNKFEVEISTSQAGGHPDVDIFQEFDNRQQNEGGDPDELNNPDCECQDAFEIKNEFPTGFIGNTNALPRCSLLAFSQKNCPPDSQVGIAGGLLVNGQNAIYNLEPHPGEPGLLGFQAPLIESPVFIELAGRTESDYGLNGRTTGITHVLPLNRVALHLWGVPGDSSHNVNRFPAPQVGNCFVPYPEPCPGKPPVSFNATVQPFLQNPTTCGQPLSMSLEIVYYDFTKVRQDAPWPATTGCDQLTFNPSLTAKPTTTQADTASGLDVDLKVPQTPSPTTPSASEIRSSTVILPEGFSINPNAADGKQVCTDEEARFGSREPAACPEHSKVGTVEIDSSALPGPIPGAIYLGTPLPGDRYRIIVAASGYSTAVKVAASVKADPVSGRLVTSFLDLPQSPLQRFSLHFFGSERGLLATPDKCGKYPVESEFVPWDAALDTQTSTAFFTIDSGPGGGPCPGAVRPFEPSVGAGSPDATAGAHSPFAFQVDRADGDQNMTRVDVATPPGFSATLAGVPYCPEEAIARLAGPSYAGLAERSSPACPAASQVGVATAGVGAGSRPFYAPGKVYLAGPYKGSKLSLLVSIPAVSGPYDLGNVAVRIAIAVDPVTAQVTSRSDELPTIVGGIPLRLRSILVSLDRPDFTLNPTSCEPFAIRSSVFGSEGAVQARSTHFQVANCAVLGFRPKLGLKLTGGTNRLGHPAIRATLTAGAGESNLAGAVVTMPKGELLDNNHIGTICSRAAFASDDCPADSVYGHATAHTPLLDKPLEGAVYLRSSDHDLPDLVADLEGQIDIELEGRVDTAKGGRLRTSFATVPDAPVSKFVLQLLGGSKGLLVNSEDLCKTRPKAAVRMSGHNGARLRSRNKLRVNCGKAARTKRESRRAGK